MSKKKIEAVLFVAKKPLTIEEITEIIEEDKRAVTRWIYELINEYSSKGVIINQVGGGFQMVTSPDCFEIASKIIPKEIESLPQSILETVSIVGYRQPVKRNMIGQLRDVQNPDYAIAMAVEKGLIRDTEQGYVTTDHFLEFFGINDLHELPKVEIQTDFTEKEDEDFNINIEIDTYDENFDIKEEIDEEVKSVLEDWDKEQNKEKINEK